MSLIPPAIVLSVGLAMLVLAYHGAKRALPEIDQALKRAEKSPDGTADNVPWTVWVIAWMVGGVAVVAIGFLWLIAALVIALVR